MKALSLPETCQTFSFPFQSVFAVFESCKWEFSKFNDEERWLWVLKENEIEIVYSFMDRLKVEISLKKYLNIRKLLSC